MIVELRPDLTHDLANDLGRRLGAHHGITVWPLRTSGRQFLLLSGDESLIPQEPLEDASVLRCVSTTADGYWLVSHHSGLPLSPVVIGSGAVGPGLPLWCAAGPCALEDLDRAIAVGHTVREQGASALRIGAFKPRTSPYNFQGRGRDGLEDLRELRKQTGLPLVTEVLDPRDVAAVAEVADCLQVGTRNMTNQALLKELGRVERPVLLKRGAGAPVVEWLRAAEFVVAHGNQNVVLCARGISSFDNSLRFQPDYGALWRVRQFSGLPVIFDPSHAAGDGAAIAQCALAAAVFGTDGLLIEAYDFPETMYAPGDGRQALHPKGLGALLQACGQVREFAHQLAMPDDGCLPDHSVK